MRRYVTTPAHVARLLLPLLALFGQAQAAEVGVPKELEDWRRWVLQGEEFRRCPFVATLGASSRDSYRCAWPERLTVALDARGGTFAQRWEVFAESWVRIPGSLEHWPQDVRVNGAPGAIVARDGRPTLLLTAGTYAITGKLAWDARPESLAIDSRTAIVDLSIDGKRVAQPERPNGDLWLGKRRTSEQPARMDVQVYRLLRDGVPAGLLTRMRLQVSGDGREELLARVLPDGFTPLSLHTDLPARLEPDGRLRVQVRAGSWDIDLDARAVGVAARLTRPAASDGLWPREEVWSFAGDDRLRVAAAQGADGIDPVQSNVPPEWRGYPAFRMAQGSTLEISERSRGLQNADDNRLTLERDVWLDFDHSGLTAVDRLTGTMRKDWRLEMAGPYSLQSARSGDDSLLVTRNPTGEGAGLEVRSPSLGLETVARTANSRGEMPATGWNARFDHVRGLLNLPPGHRLIAVLGADRAPGAWVESWGLWGLFGVLVVAVFAGWLGGRLVGAVAFIALLLTYQEAPAYIWLWSNLLAALAFARAAPDGKAQRFARSYRAVSFVVLGVALLPLLWDQARVALHPQLEGELQRAQPPALAMMEQAPPADAAAASAPPPSPTVVADVPMPVEADSAERRNLSKAMVAPEIAPATVVDNPYGLAAVAGGAFKTVIGSVDQRYAPGTLVQAGPGIPKWRYRMYLYEWSGPVDPSQSVRFIFIGPVLLGIWRFVGIALLGVLFLALLASRNRGGAPPLNLSEVFGRSAPATAAPIVLAVLASSLAVIAPSQAQATPDAELLEQLKTRLTSEPQCAPTCADITSAQVTARGERLDVSLQISALSAVAVPVPSAGDRWQLDSITLDGRSALAIGRESEGTLAVALTPGAHVVRLSGLLAAAQSIQLEFPSAPRAIAVSADGWDTSGVNEGRLLSGSLELVRRKSVGGAATPLETSSEFPAFVRVTRTFDLGLDWSVATTVSRIAPEKAAVTVEVPLLNGESALSEKLRTRDLPDGRRVALIGLERAQPAMSWSSGLARSDTLDLELPADAARAEVWSFVVSPQWNIRFEGLPAVLPVSVNPTTWVFEFHPRPGEKLRARITRPERAEGSTLAIDSLRQSVEVGKRSSTTTLQFQYRSTQGGRHLVTLPKDARVMSVHIDGTLVPLRPDNGALSIGLLPGSHAVQVQWETPVGVGVNVRPAQVDMHASASNVATAISLPLDRWPLFAAGSGVGPAFLYWSELAVFVVVAVLLGRWSRSPLRTHEWLLLGFGLSTLSWGVLVLVAAWLFALEWRQRWVPGAAGSIEAHGAQASAGAAELSSDGVAATRVRFNAVQVLLAALTVIAVGTLVFSGIRQSLLASPDMGVTGPGSGGTSFTWFIDRTESALPRPSVISLPMWAYRAVMFAWALWLVVALLRWLRWGWQAWKANGIWRGPEAPTATAA